MVIIRGANMKDIPRSEPIFIKIGLCMFLVSTGLHISRSIEVPDSTDECSLMSETICPTVHLTENDVIDQVPKYAPPNHPISSLAGIAGRTRNVICSIPACLSNPCPNHGLCEETMHGYTCHSQDSSSGDGCEDCEDFTELSPLDYIDCQDLRESGDYPSGVYAISPKEANDDVEVYCDMETDGGGWLVFQRRLNGSVNFFRNWTEYKRGFGNKNGEFWLGNDAIHLISHQKPYMMRIDIEVVNGSRYYASYSVFTVANETENYKLQINRASGNAELLMAYHNNRRFSTPDHDNDEAHSRNCAAEAHSGWWYKFCFLSNLNGPFQKNTSIPTLAFAFDVRAIELQAVSMMLKPIDYE